MKNRPQAKRKNVPTKTPEQDTIRLNRLLANAGLCSRREADQHIAMGLVAVNGKITTTLGTRVSPTDEVKFDGQTIARAKQHYVLLNKPKGFAALVKGNAKQKKTTQDLLQNSLQQQVPPVGDMGRMATGLLLLTNDAALHKKLKDNPKVKMVYHLKLTEPLTAALMSKLKKGVVLQNKTYVFDKISYLEGKAKTEIGLEVFGMAPSLVTKIFAHLNLRLVYLDRVIVGGLTKKDLARGQWRHLTPTEIQFLQMF